MAIASDAAEQAFKFPSDQVFGAAIEASKKVGWKVKESDKDLLRINLSAGMSLFSWGENITLRIEDDGDSGSRLFMESSLKMGANLTGNHRHRKNFDSICKEIVSILRR